MNPDRSEEQIDDAELQALLQNRYVALAVPGPFKEALFVELEREYQRLHRERPRGVAVRNIFASRRLQVIAASVSLVLVVGLLGFLLLSAPPNVLAQTARVLRSVKTFHFEIRAPGVPGQGIREIWLRGSTVYCRYRENGETAAEVWMDPSRCVIYDVRANRVVVKDSSVELISALRQVDIIREFRPEDWQSWPQDRVRQGDRTYQVFQMPGTGTFTGLGRRGETRMKLWIDEAKCLPAKMAGELRSDEGAEWEPFLEIQFFWDDVQVPDDFFEPKYPGTAEVLEMERKPPAAALKAPAEPIVTVSREDRPGRLTLENLWIHPAGLVILRLDLHRNVPFGEPPRLPDAEKNPWGLKPEEISLAIQGQLLFDKPVEARRLGAGGVVGRMVGYLLYEFEPDTDGTVPEKLTFRYLLARRRRTSETSFRAYGEAVLNDPSSWQLYEFSVPTQGYVTDSIPEEIYDSSNLRVERTLLPALKRIVRSYEAEGKDERALEFIRAQGPKTQSLLRPDLDRLERKRKAPR